MLVTHRRVPQYVYYRRPWKKLKVLSCGYLHAIAYAWSSTSIVSSHMHNSDYKIFSRAQVYLISYQSLPTPHMSKLTTTYYCCNSLAPHIVHRSSEVTDLSRPEFHLFQWWARMEKVATLLQRTGNGSIRCELYDSRYEGLSFVIGHTRLVNCTWLWAYFCHQGSAF